MEYITNQFDKVISIIEHDITGERSVRLIRLYHDFEEQIKFAPASSKYHYHNAYPGGYLDHILHVHDIALRMAKLYLTPDAGGTINFTKEEIIFCALHHDLGKIGDENGPMYVLETEQFWQKKGSIYKYQDRPMTTTVYDRTIYLLQKYNVTMSMHEMVAIKLTDGLYDEGNKRQLMSSDKFPFDTALPYIMHWSDHMATIIEKDEARLA